MVGSNDIMVCWYEQVERSITLMGTYGLWCLIGLDKPRRLLRFKKGSGREYPLSSSMAAFVTLGMTDM
jgi:hypothetical protein